MTSILVNCGQCGNQLSYNLTDSLFNHLDTSIEEIDDVGVFFRQSSRRQNRYYSRSVCLDTEPKVIDECVARARENGRWMYDKRSVAYRHGGAGNNWALGYQMFSGEFLETSMDCIRRELEHCERVPCLIIIHSLAGGTGSGLGTRVTESCGDEFPEVTRVNLAVSPYHFGEVVVQHYNALLSLSKISSSSDGSILFENEVAQDLCKQMKGIERPSLADINDVISSNILPTMLPKYDRDSYKTTTSSLCDDVMHLCSHPGYRFLDVKNTPQTSSQSVEFTYDSWTSIMSTISRMQIKGTPSERGLGSSGVMGSAPPRGRGGPRAPVACPNIGSVLTFHGSDAVVGAEATSTEMLTSPSRDFSSSFSSSSSTATSTHNYFLAPYVKMLDSPVKICYSRLQVNGYQRSASILSNGCTTLPLLQRVRSKAADMFSVRAYMHQYSEHGLEDADFVDAFRSLGQSIENYKGLEQRL